MCPLFLLKANQLLLSIHFSFKHICAGLQPDVLCYSRKMEVSPFGLLRPGLPQQTSLTARSGRLAEKDDLYHRKALHQEDSGRQRYPATRRYSFYHWILPLACGVSRKNDLHFRGKKVVLGQEESRCQRNSATCR